MTQKIPSTDEYVRAFKAIQSKINDNQLRMLRAHYAARARKITAPELAAAVGYKAHMGVNGNYGRLGKLLYQELRFETDVRIEILAKARKDKKNRRWIFTMRKEVAKALVILGLDRPPA